MGALSSRMHLFSSVLIFFTSSKLSKHCKKYCQGCLSCLIFTVISALFMNDLTSSQSIGLLISFFLTDMRKKREKFLKILTAPCRFDKAIVPPYTRRVKISMSSQKDVAIVGVVLSEERIKLLSC